MLYQANSLKVSLREYLFEANLLTTPVVWFIATLTKLLRVRIPGSVDFPPVEGLAPFLVASGTIQGEMGEAIATEKYWLESEQFEHCGDFFLNDATSNTRYAGAVYLSPDGTTVAWVRVRRWPQLPPKAKATRVQFTSFGQDNSPIVTTSANRDLLEPPAWQVKFYAGKPVAEVYAAHRTHVSEVLRAQRPRVLLSPRDAIEHLDQLQAEFVGFQVSRGVFEPVNMPQMVSPTSYVDEPYQITPSRYIDNEQDSAPEYVIDQDGNVTAVAETIGSNAAEPELNRSANQFLSDNRTALRLPSSDEVLIAEVRRQETKQTQLFSKLLMLVVSLAIFAGVGGALWDWTFVLMIIPILFVHELGHLIAMKMFGYKNVNMFYIPFLGAAVTGRHHNVAGWKKAMVSLAGPLPSIVLQSCWKH